MKAKYVIQPTIVISAILAQLTFAALPRYEIIDLGTLGGSYSEAWSINDSYQIVGWSANDLGARHATLFDPTGEGKNIDLGTIGGNQSEAYSISNSGQIVGSAENSSGNSHAILFDPTGNGSNTDLGTLSGYLRSSAKGISDNGQIVGYSLVVEGSYYHYRATLFDPTGDGNNLDLGTLGGSSSIAHSINNNGQIVGWARKSADYACATLFDPSGSGNNIDLGTLGGTYSVAMLINNNEKIVGMATNISDDNRATLFDATGASNNMDLGTLPGFSWSHAWSINDKGQIVGDVQVFGGTPEHLRATLFDPTGNGNNIDLNTLINPASGWTLNRVISINNSGWIVGAGDNPNGKYHAYLLKPIPPKVIYVDDDAAGANDGSSWADAYIYLQDALIAAWDGDEIRVAQGIYKPDQGVGITPGDREATFQLINGVTIKGGYAGTGTPDPNARDIDLYETILSGDLNGDDAMGFSKENWLVFLNKDENSYNVVTGSRTDRTAVIEGFTIIGGNAYDYGNRDAGGGMYINLGSPIVTNCTFTRNWAYYGGGMYNNFYSCPILTNCTFSGNSGSYYGGGMYNYSRSSPTLTNCIFWDNSARSGGGMCNKFKSNSILKNCSFIGNRPTYEYGSGSAMYNIHSSPTLTNCTFSDNTCRWTGGAMYNDSSDPNLTNCAFSRNSAKSGGGGIYNYESSPILLACVFSANWTRFWGGGMRNYFESNPKLINCVFVGNLAEDQGGGMRNNDRSSPTLTNCTFSDNSAGMGGAIYHRDGTPTLTNCILWNNKATYGHEIYLSFFSVYLPSTITVSFSNVEGGAEEVYVETGSTLNWGTSNIDSNPCFVEPGYWDANGTPEDANDDVWVDGDYHLLPNSLCINAGDPNFIAGPNETDLDGRPRVIGGRIDMGAYETPIFAEARILPRTINLASKGRWITCYIRLPDDYDVADIEPNSVLLEKGIKPKQFSVDQQTQVATAKFDREKVQSILSVGDTELTITCQLTDGTYFEATDVITVIDKGSSK